MRKERKERTMANQPWVKLFPEGVGGYGWEEILETWVPLSVDSSGKVMVKGFNSLVPSQYDNINLSYSGSNLTGVVYKNGATTVSTLTLTYAGGNLTKVEKT
jgi:hypothetical protein